MFVSEASSKCRNLSCTSKHLCSLNHASAVGLAQPTFARIRKMRTQLCCTEGALALCFASDPCFLAVLASVLHLASPPLLISGILFSFLPTCAFGSMYLMCRTLSINSVIFLQYHKMPFIYLHANILSSYVRTFSWPHANSLTKLLEALSLLSVTHSRSLIQTFSMLLLLFGCFLIKEET